MYTLNDLTIEKLAHILEPEKVKIFDKYAKKIDADNLCDVFEFCINFTLDKNKDLKRKTGAPNALHPLTIAINAIKNNLDVQSICASLLHDVIEDEIDITVKQEYPKEKNTYEYKKIIRKKLFNDLQNHLNKFNTSEDITIITSEIIAIVDILTQYKNNAQHYYEYIKYSFSPANKTAKPEMIYKSILVKFLDRLDNIITMDTQLRKVLNEKTKLELQILNLIQSQKICDKYKKTIVKQNSLLLDHSFSAGNRLIQIWKNTFLIIIARMTFCHYKLIHRDEKAKVIEKDLIEKTKTILTHHKNDLKLYLKSSVTDYWDQQARIYALMGGINGKTRPETKKRITKDNQYLRFNTTIENFSKILLKDNKEFQRLQIDKVVQYQYLALINEMLIKFSCESEFVCNIAQYVHLDDTKINQEHVDSSDYHFTPHSIKISPDL